MIPAIAVFVGIEHSVLAMSGEELLAVYREIEAPKLPNLKKAGLVCFVYSLVFTSLVSFFAVMIIPDAGSGGQHSGTLIGGLSMSLSRLRTRCDWHFTFSWSRGHADPAGAGQHGNHRFQRRSEFVS